MSERSESRLADNIGYQPDGGSNNNKNGRGWPVKVA